MVEGEQKADYLNSLGLYATTCGGSGNTDKTDLRPLARRDIVIWADNDKAGTKFFNEIASELNKLGCNVRYILLDGLNLPESRCNGLGRDTQAKRTRHHSKGYNSLNHSSLSTTITRKHVT